MGEPVKQAAVTDQRDSQCFELGILLNYSQSACDESRCGKADVAWYLALRHLCIDGGYTLAHDVRNTLDLTARSFGGLYVSGEAFDCGTLLSDMRCCGQGAGGWAVNCAFALFRALSERSLRVSSAAAHRLDSLGQCTKSDIEVRLVRKVVDFQRGEGFACRFEDVARVFEAQRVVAAAERLQAHKLQLRVLCDQARQTCKVLARFPWRAIRVVRLTRRPRV